MAGFIPKHLYKGCHHLSEETIVVCTTAETYYKIGGVWTNGTGGRCNFSYDGLGKITYDGQKAAFLFTGVSDVAADKNCTITYALYKNGVLVANAITPHIFSTANQTANISITNLFEINRGDYFEIYVKSDTNATTLTVETLYMTFLGDR